MGMGVICSQQAGSHCGFEKFSPLRGSLILNQILQNLGTRQFRGGSGAPIKCEHTLRHVLCVIIVPQAQAPIHVVDVGCHAVKRGQNLLVKECVREAKHGIHVTCVFGYRLIH